jgi:ubiquinone/menaquinone biosynthesis C-methylase UbiE
MSGYTSFSQFYDRLMEDVDYDARAGYLLSLFHKHRSEKPPNTLLDLACGSGSLSLGLIAQGVDIIGVDSSEDMLAVASDKAQKAGVGLMLLCQDMRELDLYGTVSGAVCALDSLNHLCQIDDIREVFRRLHLFIEPGGLLIFDVNTIYKHRKVLGNNAFVFEERDFICVWRNHLIARTVEVDMQLDFFVEKGEHYTRLTDSVRERAYSQQTLSRLLHQAGFETLGVYGDMTVEPPKEESERLVFVARRSSNE